MTKCTFAAGENRWRLFPAEECFKEGTQAWHDSVSPFVCDGSGSPIAVSFEMNDPHNGQEMVKKLADCGIDFPSLRAKIDARNAFFSKFSGVLAYGAV